MTHSPQPTDLTDAQLLELESCIGPEKQYPAWIYKVSKDADVPLADVLLRAALIRMQERDEAQRSAKAWEDTAKQFALNHDFYRDLVQETGRILGGRVYIQDDGGTVPDPLALRVPEVAREIVAELADLKQRQPVVDEAAALRFFKSYYSPNTGPGPGTLESIAKALKAALTPPEPEIEVTDEMVLSAQRSTCSGYEASMLRRIYRAMSKADPSRKDKP